MQKGHPAREMEATREWISFVNSPRSGGIVMVRESLKEKKKLMFIECLISIGHS